MSDVTTPSDSSDALGPEWWEAAAVADLPSDSGQMVQIEGKRIALFLQDGKVYATDDHCPHAGAPLSEGYLEKGVVTCPWHAWRFCVTDGHWADVPASKTRLICYETQIRDGKVFVRIPAGTQPSSQ